MKNLIILIIIFGGFMDNTYASLKLELSSKEFRNQEFMPKKYGCLADNISPELSWTGAPKETKSFALLVEDPDAPKQIWVHWILFNIDKNINKLEENFNIEDYKSISKDIKEGKNTFLNNNYGGPCPPEGETHKYIFRLYALDKILDLDSGATKDRFLNAISGHVLDQAELIGLYKK